MVPAAMASGKPNFETGSFHRHSRYDLEKLAVNIPKVFPCLESNKFYGKSM